MSGGILTPDHMQAIMAAVDQSLNPGQRGKDKAVGIVPHGFQLPLNLASVHALGENFEE